MNYEYNGNLLEEDRIELVANEIINKYSMISLDKAKQAATLEGKISSHKTTDDELNRLYNIMLVNSDDKEIVSIIYKDFLETLKSCVINSKQIETDKRIYINLVDGINSYFKNNTEFPLFSDYQ